MGQPANGRKTGRVERRLLGVARNEEAPTIERARALCELARRWCWLPQDLAALRRNLLAALQSSDAKTWTQYRIAKELGVDLAQINRILNRAAAEALEPGHV